MYIIYFIFGIVFIALLSNSVYSFKKLKDDKSYRLAGEVINMWKQNFIIDIVATSSSTCPSGYEDLFEYYWAGTVEGCAC